MIGCLTCSAAIDVGDAWEFKDAPCLCTLLTSVVVAIVPSCLCAMYIGLYMLHGHPYNQLISFEIFCLCSF